MLVIFVRSRLHCQFEKGTCDEKNSESYLLDEIRSVFNTTNSNDRSRYIEKFYISTALEYAKYKK
jgi:hypothetical protein